MINRRDLIFGAAAVICTAGTTGAADWKSQYPELTFAVVPAENASGVSDRFAPFIDYLSREPPNTSVNTGSSLSITPSEGIEIAQIMLPQVLPVIASQILYFFESNTRSATIIGIVGAGGIGLQLSEQIRTYDFDQVALIVLMILVAVATIDWVSGKLRFAIIGRRPIA